jgi:hypothetical protein
MGWTVGVRFREWTRDFSLLYIVQADSGAHPSSIQWVSWAISLEESVRDAKLTTHLLLVPRSRMVELYLHSPIRLHGLVFNQ